MAGVTEKLLTQPGTLYSLSGGTRTKVNLSRPWQMDLPYNPEKCPFCTKTEAEVMEVHPAWRVLGNPQTPHEFHRLVIPRACPTKDWTRTLGGRTEIENALSAYGKVAPTAWHEGFRNTVFAVHVGYLAGQNLGHTHWHLCDAMNPEKESIESTINRSYKYSNNHKKPIFENFHGFTAYVEGANAGQVYLISNSLRYIDRGMMNLAYAISEIISLYNTKFVSTQGLMPEYNVSVVARGARLRYATYVPILNQKGFPHVLAMTGDSAMTLPWPHETTVEFLKS